MKKDDHQFQELARVAFPEELNQNEIVKQLTTIRNAMISSSSFGDQSLDEQLKQSKIILIMLLQTSEGSVIPNLFSLEDLMARFFPQTRPAQ